jgi:metallo-beta-lactamase family protein
MIPLGLKDCASCERVDESKSLNKVKGPAIIISASGMAESGRILHHLRNNVGNSNNIILFVGYCAENTLGWKLRHRQSKVSILGDEFDVRAHIEIMDSFSGHADHDELLAYFSRIGGPKSHVFLVHGERSRTALLKEALEPLHPTGQIIMPDLLQEFNL